MKRILLLVAVLLSSVVASVAQNEKHHRVKIYTSDRGLVQLSGLGIETDHGDIRKNVWFITDLNDKEIQKVKQAGYRFEIMINDVSDFYRTQQSSASGGKIQVAGCGAVAAPVYNTPANFSLGSMGGYFTYQEMLDHLDSMASKYPSLITIRQPIDPGTTIEGLPVYFVKISDNPNVTEPEPEMLYTSVHHAREPGGMSQLIFYMWYLLENYATDASIQQIVDNSELFFITCINPDGYLYNEATDPNGGGMWRKNRRDNLDGSFGVDLNRNYGYNWGFDDDGSSPVGFDETYRGTGPFSEPETDMVKNFVSNYDFKIALNYHTFGNLLIYPWGYQPDIYTPDSALLVNYGMLLTTYNEYTYGTANQTVGYITNGSSDDWMYGEQVLKPKILSMTPEVGDGQWGFWPPSNEIIDICKGTMFQNLTAAQLLGRYAILNDRSQSLIEQVSGYISFDITQLGLDTNGSYTVSLTAVTANIATTGAPKLFSSLSVMQQEIDSISFSLNNTGLLFGDEVKFLLSIDNGQYVTEDTLTKIFGTPVSVYSNNGSSTTGWINSGWSVTSSDFYSPPSSITDSPFGDYQSNVNSNIRLSNPVSLANAVHASLTFYCKWAIEPDYDYVQVSVSVNNGVTWIPLCGKYTTIGTQAQDDGEPVYEGFQSAWVMEEMSLDDYLGQNIHIRFLIISDSWQEYDGFYFDDVEISKVLPGGVGVSENLQNGDFFISASPNPASDAITFNYHSEAGSTLLVYDGTGRMVNSVNLKDAFGKLTINTSELTSGMYSYSLNGSKQILKGKIAIIK